MIPAGTNWVFNKPFFIIMNVAVGGNWPGYPDGTTVMPQTMKVDYVRVYQAPDTAERFETTFVDNTVGWRKVILPFSNFKRSATQPVNAPNDGLTLTQAQGYRFDLVGTPATLAPWSHRRCLVSSISTMSSRQVSLQSSCRSFAAKVS